MIDVKKLDYVKRRKMKNDISWDKNTPANRDLTSTS